jgi:hypothetical protein
MLTTMRQGVHVAGVEEKVDLLSGLLLVMDF